MTIFAAVSIITAAALIFDDAYNGKTSESFKSNSDSQKANKSSK